MQLNNLEDYSVPLTINACNPFDPFDFLKKLDCAQSVECVFAGEHIEMVIKNGLVAQFASR